MEVILLETVKHVGRLGDRVNVRAGYARNYLIPKCYAASATVENLRIFEAQRVQLEEKLQERLQAAQARSEALSQLSQVMIRAQAGTEGKLFGSVGAADVVRALKEAGMIIEKHEVRLPQGPLRQLGDFEIELQLHTDIVSRITISIIPLE
jgi:large subunit ribosomal protein L9